MRILNDIMIYEQLNESFKNKLLNHLIHQFNIFGGIFE